MKRALLVTVTVLIISALGVHLDGQSSGEPACMQLISAGDETSTDPGTIASVARCFVRHQDNLEAAHWYEKIVDQKDCPPQYILEYGQCLKSLSLYGKAKFYFQKYAQYDPVAGHQFVQSCDIARMTLEGDRLYDLTSLNGNSVHTELSPMPSKNTVVFSHISADQKISVRASSGKTEVDINGVHVRYSTNGSTMVYASTAFRNGERLLPALSGGKILISQRNVSDDWSEFREVPVGGTGYSVAYPAISGDGTYLYFASDMPGGQGGWDLYVTKWEGQNWSTPQNLGSGINTPGNEISPFVTLDHLYFSSDWHPGLGGFDVFMASLSGKGFGDVHPVGYPVNSPKDDLDFVWDETSGAGYFASNRTGSIGSYDVYKAVPLYTELEITVRHHLNMEPVEDAMLVVTPGISRAVYTDQWGIGTIRHNFRSGHEVLIQKDGFAEYRVKAPSGNTRPTVQMDVYLEQVIAQPLAQTPKPEPAPVQKPVVEAAKPKEAERTVPAPVQVTEPVPVRKVSEKQVEKYFIQIAALAKHSDISPFSGLRMYGDLLVHDDEMYSRVRVGTFETDSEARTVLERVRAGGYPDAFVVKDAVSVKSNTIAHAEYKVRLATYSKVGNFDPTPIAHLGEIESYRKDDKTIMLLAGYASLTAAQQARTEAVAKGFRDAYVVMDNNGVLERVK